VIAALLLAPAAIGVFDGWGAFRGARSCYAIARPVVAGGRRGGFASVADWPARGGGPSLHVHLSLPRDRAAPVTLTVGERRFALVAGTRDAWAADAASDRAIVAAMRSGRSMSVEAVGPRGRPFADSYALAGAATAIDAARLECRRR